MGLRTRAKNRVLKLINTFTGEHSAGSDTIKTSDGYESQGNADENINTQRARLKKPRD